MSASHASVPLGAQRGGSQPHVRFGREEPAERQARVRDRTVEPGYHGVLRSKIEDADRLSGFDSDGFCVLHHMFIGVNDELR